jgi:signal peptidase I
MKKIFKIIYYIFFAAIATIAILLVISILPITGNYKILVVQSGSMEPVIHTGAIVIVKPESDYKVGDIITFGPATKTKTPTTHRIVEIKGEGIASVYTTKGDANNTPDTKEVSKREVIGKVLFSVLYIGFAIAAAKKPFGFLLIIVVPALIIIYEEIEKIWQEIKRVRAEKNKKKEEDVNIVK